LTYPARTAKALRKLKTFDADIMYASPLPGQDDEVSLLSDTEAIPCV
jgi:hypothetical protein